MSELQFYRDEAGAPRAKGEDIRLAAFLESDIQDSIEIAEDLASLLKFPQEAEFNGNAHSLSIDPKTVCISNQFDNSAPDRRMSRSDFAEVLEDWLEFLRATSQKT